MNNKKRNEPTLRNISYIEEILVISPYFCVEFSKLSLSKVVLKIKMIFVGVSLYMRPYYNLPQLFLPSAEVFRLFGQIKTI